MSRSINECLNTLRCLTGQPPKKSGNEWVSFCPIHEADGQGHKPSLTLREGDRQGVIVNCHAGCDSRDILKVLGVERSTSPSKEPVIYSYRDQTGGEVRQKVRFEPKDFRIRHQGAAGEWVYKAGAGPAVLYRLPELKVAIAEGRTVFLCEGEKDVDRLTALGLCATTNIEGAAQPNQRAKWRDEYTAQLTGAARVILLPDNDAPGRAHMAHIAQQLAGKAADVRTLVLPDLPEKGDVSDWLKTHTVEELKALAQTSPAESKTNSPIPPLRPFGEKELTEARLHPRCIVENLLYADLALVAAAGGTGKTTTLIYEAACIATGRDLWGCRVLTPGSTLFITAEDSRELFAARLREVIAAMGLSDYERRLVLEGITVWDVSGDMMRLAELDQGGNIRLTELADGIVNAYKGDNLVQVVFDPAISFGPGERMVNDGEQAVVTACRRIVRGLNCCVRLIHHTGKANARVGAIDQYASRGGTALPDGCRMVTILSTVGESGHCAAIAPEGFDLQPGESGFIMARAKLSYAPPQPNIWIRRRGFAFEYFIEQPRNSDQARSIDADKVAHLLVDELHHGRKYTARALEDSGKTKLPRARLRAALATLETTGRLEERELPQDERRGKRKNYLFVRYCAEPAGAIAPDTTPPQPLSSPIAPSVSIAPPYRESTYGAIDAVMSLPQSLNAPDCNGAIAAQWRNSEKGQITDCKPASCAEGLASFSHMSMPLSKPLECPDVEATNPDGGTWEEF